MKYCRFENEGVIDWGLIESVGGRAMITAIVESPEHGAELQPKSIAPLALNHARLVAPVQPSKIVCVGRNYRQHAKELGNEAPAEPLIFLKPPSSLIASNDSIVYPALTENVH